MYSALKEGSNLKLYGNGLDARCFTHLNDVRNIVTKLSGIRKDFAEPLIISNSSFNTIEEIANEIAESMNFRNEIIFQDVDDATYTVKKVDNSKLLSTIGGYEFLDLKSGINLTVQQFLQNQALSI
jgi:nucleoside-diphosphate-sugar epimerase